MTAVGVMTARMAGAMTGGAHGAHAALRYAGDETLNMDCILTFGSCRGVTETATTIDTGKLRGTEETITVEGTGRGIGRGASLEIAP